jgi:ComF family protein
MYIINAILDLFFPRYCLMCDTRLLLEENTICLHCNIRLPRTFLWSNPTNNNLAKRFWGKLPIEQAVAYLYYYPQSPTANIVYAFKYRQEPYTAEYMGAMMAKEIGTTEFFSDIDCLIPIPITKQRLRKRGYNQSEKLAQGIESVVHIPVIANAVKRIKSNISQTKLEKFDRPDNIKQAFELTSHAGRLTGKHCLIIDDVITTGSTTAECAKEILKVQGTKVSILSLCCIRNKK